MRTECPVLSLAASPTLWDQHSNRGRVGRWPRDRGRGWRRDPVLSSGGGVCNPCPSPGMVLGAAGASPVLPRGWSWGRCQHPLVLPGDGPGGILAIYLTLPLLILRFFLIDNT